MTPNRPFPEPYASALADAFLTAAARKLERNDASRVHKLIEAMHNKLVFDADSGALIAGLAIHTADHVFVARHDWGAVLKAELAEGTESGPLPYDSCVFEFRMRGRTIVVMVGHSEVTPGVDMAMFIEATQGCWVTGADLANCLAPYLLTLQIRAILLALEAQVAHHRLVTAPAALNKKRERSAKPPLYDYHVVELVQRANRNAPSARLRPSGSVRLHFSRGHWRHFENGTKTWVTWCLKGNPDLGWIDKEYRI